MSSKKKGNKKGAKSEIAPNAEVLKMERSEPGKTTVTGGKGVFDENGKMIRPKGDFRADGNGGIEVTVKKTAEQILAERANSPDPKVRAKVAEVEKIAKKSDENQKKLAEKKLEPEVPLVPVPEEIEAICNVTFIQNQTQRNSLIQVVKELTTMSELTLVKDHEGVLVVKLGARRICKLIPYKRLWSYAQNEGGTIRPSAEEAMRLIKTEIEALKTKELPVAETFVSA